MPVFEDRFAIAYPVLTNLGWLLDVFALLFVPAKDLLDLNTAAIGLDIVQLAGRLGERLVLRAEDFVVVQP